jgi:hypothetical protein
MISKVDHISADSSYRPWTIHFLVKKSMAPCYDPMEQRKIDLRTGDFETQL